MTRFQKIMLVAVFLIPACGSPPEPATPGPVPPARVSGPGEPVPATKDLPPPPPTPVLPRHPLKVRLSSYDGIEFTTVTFDRRDHFLKVVDQKGGPGSLFANAQAAAQGGMAAINGGFFSPEGTPVGLVITGGEARGYLNSASYLGTGILDGKKVSLATRETYRRSSELLQSGPRLVWKGETLTGLSRGNPRPRSFMIWDGAEHFGLAYADSASLKGLSQALQSQPIPGFEINYAVNLDGGTSCDFWVSGSVPEGGFTRSSFFRKKARNYLVLRRR